MTEMRFGSLFAGIGGIDLGLERAGMTCAWQVEIDPFCRRVLTKHWPDVPKFADVRECGAHNLEPVDLIAGGFPCQDISNAGKRAGIEGERSGLWTEYARIVRELRPRYVLVENVAALLGRGLDRVLGDLAESGYGAEWDCIPAAAVGAPHRRDRLYLVAHDDRFGGPAWARLSAREGTGLPDADRSGGRGASERRNGVADPEGVGCRTGRTRGIAAHGEGGAGAAVPPSPHAQRDGLEGLEPSGPTPRGQLLGDGSWWATEPDVGRVADGVPARVDRLRALGNAVVPQVAEFIGRRLMGAA